MKYDYNTDFRAINEQHGGQRTQANKPLAFQLPVDVLHPYVTTLGISRETADLFGVGYFTGRGSMTDRVVIPIHNERGELVAYAGRSIDGSEPKYKLPPGFQKSLTLFNAHRAMLKNQARMVVLVEGFFDCMKVHQAGYPTVALMGCSMSSRQEEILVAHFGWVWLLLDGDPAGRTAAGKCAARLMHRIFVRVVSLPEDKKPDMLNGQELRELLKH